MTTDPVNPRIAIRWLPLDALTPDPGNARLHSDAQIARIADSIAAFGFNVPLLVDGEGRILAGHGRLLAARRLALAEVPTIAIGHLDEARRRAFMIADNRLGELAGWDSGRLRLELAGLRRLSLDFSLAATGFELGEVDLRIGAIGAPGAAVDSPSEDGRPGGRPMDPDGAVSDRAHSGGSAAGDGGRQRAGAPVARAGDLWRLGPHRLVCGGAAEAKSLAALDAAIRRWQALSGEKARLEPAGESFAAAARSRRGRRGRDARGAAA